MVNEAKCIGCGACVNSCPVDAISFLANGKAHIDKQKCIGCGMCENICPVNAIKIR